MFSPSSRRRQFEQAFSREKLTAFARTMIWVAPLTILIWVYAEREQIATVSDVTFPVRVHIAAPDRIASLARTEQRAVTVELQGPRVRLDSLRQQLASLPAGGLTIELDPETPTGPVNRRLTDLLNNDVPLFKNFGVKVTTASPATLTLQIDELASRDVVVTADPALANFDAPPAFDPPTVKVTGPKPLIDRLGPVDSSGRPTLRADLASNLPQLKTPGLHDLADVPLSKPRIPGLDDPALLDLLSASTDRVRVSFRVRQTDITFVIPAMPVFPLAPAAFLDEYRAVHEPVVTNVTVQGPPELIAALRNDTLAKKPKAILEFGRDDLPPGRALTRKLRFDLPEGITISPADQARDFEFTLLPRSKPE